MPRVLISFLRVKRRFVPLAFSLLSVIWILGGWTPQVQAVTNLVFDDEFNGTNIDTTKWGFDLSNTSTLAGTGWGNNEKEYYTSRTNNAYVTNGLLHIVASNDGTMGFSYTSARLRTLGLFSNTYGRVEFRAKLPAPSGYWWPALWMLAANYAGGSNPTNHWPQCGEIDVMENKRGTNQVQGTLHYDTTNAPGSDIGGGAGDGATFPFPPGDSVTNFHTYVLSWSSNLITIAVDSTVYKTSTSWTSSVGPFPTPFNHPFYLIMNLAIGGNFVGNPSEATINAATTFPGDMQIDYVRVYQEFPGNGMPPLILSVTPSNGCMSGGTTITIGGSNYVPGATVKIGGATAGNVTFVNTNTLTAITPSFLSAGPRNVTVTNPDAQTGTLTNGYTYLSAPTFAGLASATAATGGATLTWAAGSGVAPITYNIFEATSSGGENYGSPLLTTNGLSVFVSSLNCSTTYYFVARALDGCGNSDNNLVERSVRPLSAPTVFAGLSNAAAATDGATLSWSAASGQSPITYSVFEAATSGGENYGSPLLTTNSLSVFVSPLNCSSTYYFVVRAAGGCGNSESNSVERSVQPLASPIVFSGMTNATAATDGATLSWSAASGESPIAYKVFQATSSGGENFGSPVLTTNGLSTFIPSLSCSNTYYFVVRAAGGCGSGDNNSVERSVQPLPVPTVFSGLSNAVAAIEGATLTWSAGSGESPIAYNVFEATASGAENYGSPVLTTNGLSAFIAPLYPGSNSPLTYFFVVRAQGGCGSGESNTVEKSVQPLLDPNKSQVGDGISNGWKQQYGFSPFDPSVAAADPDGDGMANMQEFLTSTDPTNGVSYFHVISIAPQGDDVFITWMCGGGRTNVVQATYDLGSDYSDVSSNIVLSGTGDSVTNYLDVSAGTNSPMFLYRIRLVP